MKFPFSTHITPETVDEKEEARKQRICNMADSYPALKQAMHGKTWQEIYRLPMAQQKD